jgi:hypothetical protein
VAAGLDGDRLETGYEVRVRNGSFTARNIAQHLTSLLFSTLPGIVGESVRHFAPQCIECGSGEREPPAFNLA